MELELVKQCYLQLLACNRSIQSMVDIYVAAREIANWNGYTSTSAIYYGKVVEQLEKYKLKKDR